MRRLNRVVTVLLILLSIAGVAAAVMLLRDEKALSVARQQQVSKLSEALQPIDEKRKELQSQEKEWQARLEEARYGKPCVMLSFDTMESSLYKTMYELMDQYGFRGTFIMRDGKMPGGSEDDITGEEFAELMDSGWEYAVGISDGSESEQEDELDFLAGLNVTQDSSEEQDEEAQEETETEDNRSYAERLDSSLSAFESYQIEKPVTLFCTQEQYGEVSEAKLTGWGFQTVCTLNKEEFPVIEEKTGDLRVIDSGIFKQKDLDVEKVIQTAVLNKQSISITINDVQKISQNASYDLSLTKFTSLLTCLKNFEEQGELSVLTYSEYVQYAEQQEQVYEELLDNYSAFRQEMNQQIEELDQQEQDIVDSLRITEAQE